MGTISEKLIYLNNTKNEIKKKINDLGGNILEGTTFRNYTTALDKIWDGMAHVENSGTNFTMTNTSNGKIKFKLKGQLSQNTTIGKNLIGIVGLENVAGRKTTTVNNVNFTLNDDGTITCVGTANARIVLYLSFNVKESPYGPGTYYYYTNSKNANFRIEQETEVDGTVKYLNSYSESNSQTAQTSYLIKKIYIVIENGQIVNRTLKVLVEKDTFTNEYEPYTGLLAAPNYNYPQKINITKENNNISIIKKNLFDKNNTIDGKFMNNATGLPQNNSAFCISNKMIVEPSTQYYITSNAARQICYFDKDNHFIDNATDIYKNGLITTPSNAAYMYFSPMMNEKDIVMIEKGSAATTYEEYLNQQYSLNLGIKNFLQIDKFSDGTTSKTQNGITATINNDGSVTVHGTASARTVFYFKKNNFDLLGKFYYWSNSGGDAQLQILVELNGTEAYLSSYNEPTYRNANVSFLYKNIYLIVTEGTTVNKTFKAMVGLGDVWQTYAPYNQPLLEAGKIDNDSEDEILKPSDKNKFNKNNVERIYAYFQSDTVWRYYNDSYSIRIPCKTNTHYVISADNSDETIFRAGVTDSESIPTEENSIEVYSTTRYSDTNEPIYITTGENAKYIIIQVSESSAIETFNTLMIEEGTVKTDYEPYPGKWYLKKKIGKAILDSNLTWGHTDLTTGTRYYTTSYNNLPNKNSSGEDILSDYFKGVSYSTYYSDGNIDGISYSYYSNKNYIQLFFKNSFSSMEAFYTWLNEHTPIAYYKLRNPEYVLLNEELQQQLNYLEANISSYADITKIEQMNINLPFKIEMVAIKKY